MINFSKTAFFTICSANYIPTAKILLDGLKENTVNDIFLIVCDGKRDNLNKYFVNSDVNIIYAEDLEIENFKDFAFRYSILELNTAIKPFVFNYLINRGFEKIFYFDPDISIENSLNDFEDILEEYDAVVTPHLLSPFTDNEKPNLDDITNSGIYNLGFLGLSSNNTEIFLQWWMQKCKYYCYSDIENNLFTDQKFCNYLPSFIEKTKIYHRTDANIAYWNLHEREIEKKENRYFCNSKPVIFFHFSGLVSDDNFKFKYISKHESRFKSNVSEGLKEKIDEYLTDLSGNTREFKKLKINESYSFNKVDDIFLDKFTRSYIKEIEKRNLFINMNQIDKKWFFEDSDELQGYLGIKRYLLGIYFGRKDLQDNFDITTDNGYVAFLGWLSNEISIGNIKEEIKDLIPKKIVDENKISFFKKALIIFLVRLSNKFPFFFRHPRLINIKLSLKKVLFSNLQQQTDQEKVRLFQPINDKNLLNKDGINIFGYFGENTGVAGGAKLMISMLQELSYKISRNIVNIKDNSFISKSDQNQKVWNISLFHINADQMQNVVRGLDPYYLSNYKIGYWAWELERFPSEYLKSGKYLNDLWVPSQFIADSIERSCNFIPKVIPHPVKKHTEGTHNIDKRFNLYDKFFLTGAMDLNSYVDRKNPFAILDSFLLACSDNSFKKDAALILKLSGNFKKMKTVQKIMAFKEKHDLDIRIIDEILTDKEMDGLRNITDVFISLHRSEGFGLNLIENMSAGNIVIGTNYSGNKQFMNKDNSLLVDFKLIPVKENQYPHWKGQFWADPSIEDAAKKILWSYKNINKSNKIAGAGKRFVMDNFSIEKISQEVFKAIQSIK